MPVLFVVLLDLLTIQFGEDIIANLFLRFFSEEIFFGQWDRIIIFIIQLEMYGKDILSADDSSRMLMTMESNALIDGDIFRLLLKLPTFRTEFLKEFIRWTNGIGFVDVRLHGRINVRLVTVSVPQRAFRQTCWKRRQRCGCGRRDLSEGVQWGGGRLRRWLRFRSNSWSNRSTTACVERLTPKIGAEEPSRRWPSRCGHGRRRLKGQWRWGFMFDVDQRNHLWRLSRRTWTTRFTDRDHFETVRVHRSFWKERKRQNKKNVHRVYFLLIRLNAYLHMWNEQTASRCFSFSMASVLYWLEQTAHSIPNESQVFAWHRFSRLIRRGVDALTRNFTGIFTPECRWFIPLWYRSQRNIDGHEVVQVNFIPNAISYAVSRTNQIDRDPRVSNRHERAIRSIFAWGELLMSKDSFDRKKRSSPLLGWEMEKNSSIREKLVRVWCIVFLTSSDPSFWSR